MSVKIIKNYIEGEWVESESKQLLDVINPAKNEVIAKVPLSTTKEVNQAIESANKAFQSWKEIPSTTRARYMFKLKDLLERNSEELAQITVNENGKTIEEAKGEIIRGIENVEVATGIPSLMMGYNLEDVSKGIDTNTIRQPIGTFCAVPPFNFPVMVPLWFFPQAIASGNTFILKPSEQVPLSQNKIFEIIHEVGLPKGVINLVNGSKEVVDTLLENKLIKGISFVGSSPVAKYIYSKAANNGKRVQCLAGAKNFIIVMPDSTLEKTTDGIIGSAFGCAGERCLAGSTIVAVGESYTKLKKSLLDSASKLIIGYGLDKDVDMGPVISNNHKNKVMEYIEKGIDEGAKLILDGRKINNSKYPNGFFIGPTIFDEVNPEMTIAKEEIFGPVLSIIKAKDLEQAIKILNDSKYGNAASIFTSSGKVAREFQHKVQAGMVGVNISVPAPIAFFPFTGWKESFYGDLHGHGKDAIEFYTEKKVITSRWF